MTNITATFDPGTQNDPPEQTPEAANLGHDPNMASPQPDEKRFPGREPAGKPRRSPAEAVPEPRTPLAVLNTVVDMVDVVGEDCGTNCNVITRWYGVNDAWCAMTVSFALFHGGFNDDTRIDVPDVATTTTRGWAFVPFMTQNFSDAGLFDNSPRQGDIFITNGMEHTGLVWSVNDDGSIISIEGNWQDRVLSQRWLPSELEGFCHPPYAPELDPTTRALIVDLHAAMSAEKMGEFPQPRLARLETAILRMAASKEAR
jgi:hypothetical protein